VASAAAQVFQVEGGSSSLYGATGGGLKVYTENYEGQFGLGSAQGWKAGGSLKTQRFGHVLLLGDDMIHLELPTDVFGGSRFSYTRGVSLARKGKRGGLLGFAGVSSDIFSTPFFKTAEADRPLGLFFGDYRIQPDLRLFTRNSFSREIGSLHGMEWQASPEILTAVSGGVMANQPYLASSLSAEKPWVSLKASYVLAARPPARRIIATTASSSSQSKRGSVADQNGSQANKENILVSFPLKPYLTLAGGRQNFLQADAAGSASLAASVNHFGVSMNLARYQIGGSIYDSRTESYRNLGAALSLAFPVADRVRVISNYFRSVPSGSKAFDTLSLTLQETVTPYLGLSQLVTRTDGRTTVSFGGSLLTNFLKVSADWQTFLVPFLRGNQFKQALVLRVDLRLPGDMQLQGGTDIMPDGSVRYTTYGSSFLYHQGFPQIQGPTISFPKYLLKGQVADENSNPIAGAALRIGGEDVFTGSDGRFFLRARKTGPHRLQVMFENFLAPGSYTLVSAPSEVAAASEQEATEIKVVVRRLANRSASSPTADLNSGEMNAVSTQARPEQSARVESEVVPLQPLEGVVADADGNPAEGVAVRLLPNSQYTTTNRSGRFGFYNLPEGDYVIELVKSTLPENARLATPGSLPVSVRYGTDAGPVHFRYEVAPAAPKPLRKVIVKSAQPAVRPLDSRKEQPRGKRRVIVRTTR
jgi:hypothetical protein